MSDVGIKKDAIEPQLIVVNKVDGGINNKLFGNKRKIILIISLLILLGTLCTVFFICRYYKDKNKPPQITAAQINNDNSSVNNQDLTQFIKKNTNDQSYKPGQSVNINKDSSFATSKALAVSFKRLDDLNNALSAYAVAATKIDTNDKTVAFEFYDDYGGVASSANQRDIAIQAYTKAREFFLQTDVAKNDQMYRDRILSNIDSAIKDLKAGTN